MNDKDKEKIFNSLNIILNNINIKYYFIVIKNKLNYNDINIYLKYIFIYNLLNNSKYLNYKKHHNKYILYYEKHNIYFDIINVNDFKVNLKILKNYYNIQINKLKKIFNNIINTINNYSSCILNPLYQSNFFNQIQNQLLQFKYFYNNKFDLKDYFIDLILTNLYDYNELYKYDKIEDINDIINFKNIFFNFFYF